jgi:hypothetical protein
MVHVLAFERQTRHFHFQSTELSYKLCAVVFVALLDGHLDFALFD